MDDWKHMEILRKWDTWWNKLVLLEIFAGLQSEYN